MEQLDLHGTKHSEVQRILENFLYQHIQKETKEIEIITGNSLHMKKLVNDVLSDYDMTSRESWGNFGILIVNMT